MTNAEQTIKFLARLDPDYHTFVSDLPPELSHTTTALPEGLAEEVVALLRAEQPKLFEKLDIHADASPGRPGFDPLSGDHVTKGMVTAIPLLAAPTLSVALVSAIIFLLQTHFKIDINIVGNHFIIDHPPIDNEQLKSVLDKLDKLLSTISGG
ncbi:MAG: hypothetical protein FWC60_08315 [Firmicutes bacterium]|nr:hypothetical protein [Bacillota bacterium]